MQPTDNPRRITVVLCDDVPALRALLRAVLEEQPGIEVVGEAGDGGEVVADVARLQPDVVLLDLAMPHMDGLQATPLILEASPGTRVVGLSGFARGQVAQQLLEAGAVAYLEKGVDLEIIVRTVVEAAAGRTSDELAA
jgi:DNA-binding NarL/FixJ family response regulator